MGADLDASPGPAALESAVFLAGQVDGAEGRRGEGGEHARVGGDRVGDALAAREPGADELVGVGAVHLCTRWAEGGAAGLAGNRQHPAGFVDGRIAVQQFPGGAVDVIDAAAQQDGLDAPACLPDGTSGEGKDGQGGAPLVGWTSGGRPVARSGSLRCVMISGAMPRLACQVACRSGCGVCGFSTVTGHLVTPPARASHGHPALRESLMALMREAYQLSSSQH
jgi:hypothetical protein